MYILCLTMTPRTLKILDSKTFALQTDIPTDIQWILKTALVFIKTNLVGGKCIFQLLFSTPLLQGWWWKVLAAAWFAVPTGSGANRTAARAMSALSETLKVWRRWWWCGITERRPITGAPAPMIWGFWTRRQPAANMMEQCVIPADNSLFLVLGRIINR